MVQGCAVVFMYMTVVMSKRKIIVIRVGIIEIRIHRDVLQSLNWFGIYGIGCLGKLSL